MSLDGFIKRNLYWANDRLKGRPVLQHYTDIRRILESKDSGRQAQHLQDLLRHAKAHSRFYASWPTDNFFSLPVMNKELIRKNYKDICVPVADVPFHQGKMHIQRTSGSTGMPLAVPQDLRKRNRRVAELKYFGTLAGYKSHEKMAQLRIWTKWHSKSRMQSFMENIYAVDCSKMDDDMLQKLTDLVNRKRITALWGYASWYDRLVEYAERRSLTMPSLKIAIAGSEMLQPSTRAKLSALLNCASVSRYSNEELGILGQDRVDDETFLLNHASYYFEFLQLDHDEPAQPGELCRIVVTDLFNFAFPMIRYDTGDTGLYAYAGQGTNGFTELRKIYGRLLDLVYDVDHAPVHPMALARILKNYDEIVLWQFIQKDADTYELRLKVNGDLNVSDCRRQMESVFGQRANIEIRFVEDIPVLSSGKRKPVVNEWKR